MNEPTKVGTGHYELYEGDQITVGMTHEIKVGYDKSWVKMEAITKIRPDETGDEASRRAIGYVNRTVMDAVAQAVETVRRFNA